MNWTLASQFFIALIAVINPLAKIPLWVELNDHESREIRFPLAGLVVLTATAVLLVTLFAGGAVLDLFGIDVASFRIGGGIVILLIGLAMLNGQIHPPEVDDENEKGMARVRKRFQAIAVPMAVPLIAGPGAISTVLLYGNQVRSWPDHLLLGGVVVVVVGGIVLATLLCAHRVQHLVGETFLIVQTRLFGLILAAIAAQLIVEGLGEAFPAWLDASSPLMDDLRQQGADPVSGKGGEL